MNKVYDFVHLLSDPASRKMLAMTSQASDSQPPAEAIGDIYCFGCGYNLRGLSEQSTCPECGRPVSATTQGQLAAIADPAWLKRLSRGAGILAANIPAHFLAIIACVLLTAIYNSREILNWSLITMTGVTTLWASAALWVLTPREPEAPYRWPSKNWRRATRAYSVLLLASAVAAMMGQLWGNFFVRLFVPFTLIGMPLLAWAMALIVLHRLSFRVPHPHLGRWTRIFLVATILAACFPYLCWVWYITRASGSLYANEIGAAMVVVSLIALGVVSYLGWRLLMLYQQVLRETSLASEKLREQRAE